MTSWYVIGTKGRNAGASCASTDLGQPRVRLRPRAGGRPRLSEQGKIGDALTVEQGYEAARLSALSMLAALNETLRDLDRVIGWLRAVGYVNCTPGFPRTFVVVNGFSDLILQLWGEPGRHARAAPGVAALPFDIPIVVEATVEIAA
jgi:enamine deaminase RidA (YjgF/YER057c/UK114 family)